MTDLPGNPLSKLKLDAWFMVFITIGALILLFAILISDKELMLLGFGFFMIGIGEWKNRKWINWEQTASIFNPYMRGSIPVRKPDALGSILDILGFISLILWGLGFFEIYHVV